MNGSDGSQSARAFGLVPTPLLLAAALFLCPSSLPAPDANHDGLDDLWAETHGVAPFSGAANPDGDPRINLVESLNFSDPNTPDSGLGLVIIQDADGDGMDDFWQLLHNVAAEDALADTDGDGRTALEESYVWSNPNAADAPGGSLGGAGSPAAAPAGPTCLALAIQTRPGSLYALEMSPNQEHWSPVPGAEPWWGDGQRREFEVEAGGEMALFRFRVESNADYDGDGLSGWHEAMVFHTSDGSRDSDGDGMEDGAEVRSGLNPNDSGSSNPDEAPDGDKDHDGLSNAEEMEIGTRSDKADTDGDGVVDGEDGWAGGEDMQSERLLAPPRLPIPRFAVLDLGEGEGRFLDNQGRAVSVEGTNWFFHESGERITIGAGHIATVTAMSSDGRVAGTRFKREPTQEQIAGLPDSAYTNVLWWESEGFTWTRGSGASALPSRWDWRTGDIDFGDTIGEGFFTRSVSVSDLNNSGTWVGGYWERWDLQYEWISQYECGIAALGGAPVGDIAGFFVPYQSSPVNVTEVGHNLVNLKAINNAGTEVGIASEIETIEGYLNYTARTWAWWNGARRIADAAAYGINSGGHVVGSQWDGDDPGCKIWVDGDPDKAARIPWTGKLNSRMEMLGGGSLWINYRAQDLAALTPATQGTNAVWSNLTGADINDQGLIVGRAIKIADGKQHAVLLLPIEVNFISRDPETGEFNNLGGELSESDPRPMLELTDVQAQFLGNGDLQISIQGETRDLLSEFLESGAGNVSSVEIYLDGELVETVSNLSGGSGSVDPLSPWQRNDSTKTFSKTVTVSGVSPGVHSLYAKTSANAVGNSGWDTASILLSKQQYGDVIYSGAPTIDVVLSGNHSASTSDRITLEVAGVQPTALQELQGQPASGIFTGQISIGGSPRNFTVKLPAAITLGGGSVENIAAEISYEDSAGRMITLPGVWQETGASTGRFHNGNQVATVESWENLKVDGVTITEDRRHRTFEPAVARVTLPESVEDWFGQEGWLKAELNGEEIELKPLEGVTPGDEAPQGMKHFFIAQSNEARTFLAHSDISDAHYPSEVKSGGQFDLQLLSDDGGEPIYQHLHSVVKRVALDQTSGTQAGGGGGSASSSQQSGYTKADMLLFFEIIFGQTGKNLLTAYENAGLVVEEPAAFWLGDLRTYRFENLMQIDQNEGRTPRLWINSGRFKTPVDAAVALFNAIQHLHEKAEGASAVTLRTDLALAEWNQLFDSGDTEAAIAAWQNQNLKALEGVVVGLTESVKIGMSFALVGDVIVTTVDTREQVVQGNAAGAAIIVGMALTPEVIEQLFKFMKRGGKSLLLNLPGNIQSQWGDEAFGALAEAAKKEKRHERLQALRGAVQEGKVSREQMKALYDSGWLKMKNSRDNLTVNMEDLYGAARKNQRVHHDLPVAADLEWRFVVVGLDPNDPLLGRYIDAAKHTRWSSATGFPRGGPFNRVWRDFFDAHPEATAEQILDHLNKIRRGEIKVTLPDGTQIDFR